VREAAARNNEKRRSMSLWKGLVDIMTTPIPNPFTVWGYWGEVPSDTGRKPRQTKSRKGTTKKRQVASAFSVEGILAPGRAAQFSVRGRDLMIDEETWIFGELRVGSTVHIKGLITSDERWLCTSITTHS